MDWKEIGFNSVEEYNASIERAKRAKKNTVDTIAQGVENANRLRDQLDERGRLDLNAMAEGARLEELDKVVMTRMYWEEQAAAQAKHDQAVQDLINKTGEATRADNERAAQAAIEKEKAEALKAIEDKHRKENNVFVDPLDAAYRALLKKD